MQLRRRASTWTSVGSIVLLLLAVVVVDQLGELKGPEEYYAGGGRRLSLFPADPLIDRPYHSAPNRGLIFIHCILIGYMLLGLNTVCDIYFSGALEIMVEQWKIKPDVAGATFMAAGGSAPEFFTSLVGAIITNDDVGFSTIVGSAVFNVLFVIGLCGFTASAAISLTWWPLFRDCFFYVIGLGLLFVFASDESITLGEAIGLFACYLVYCVIMYNNDRLEALTDSEFLRAKKQLPCESEKWACPVASVSCRQETATASSTAVSPEPIPVISKDVESMIMGHSENSDLPRPARTSQDSAAATKDLRRKVRASTYSGMAAAQRHDDRMASLGLGVGGNNSPTGGKHRLSEKGACSTSRRHSEKGACSTSSARRQSDGGVCSCCKGQGPPGPPEKPKLPPPPPPEEVGATAESEAEAASSAAGATKPATVAMEQGVGDEESEEEEDDDLLSPPEGTLDRIIWFVSLPIYVPVYYSIPKPSEKYFLATFALSLLWIAGLAFFMIWWVEVLGAVLGIGNNIMGLTLLAAGTSIPDAVSSVAVARNGQGDMAISSSIGSNIFDILVGLPIPWILKIGFLEGLAKGQRYSQRIHSPYIAVYVLLLLVMVFSVVVVIHFMGWTLNRQLGICMTTLYLMFIIFAITVEATTPSWLAFDI